MVGFPDIKLRWVTKIHGMLAMLMPYPVQSPFADQNTVTPA